MQRLLNALIVGLLVCTLARADSLVTALPSATIPLPANSAIYVDQAGVDTQLTGDIATGLGLNVSAANTMRGNWTGSTGNDAANAMPSCADSGGNHLNYVSGTGITCGTSAVSKATSAPALTDPPGVTSASLLMQGLGGTFTITPLSASGKVHIAFSGIYTNNTSGIQANYEILYGTGTAPVNGAASTGTLCGKLKNTVLNSTTSKVTFSLDCLATGLTQNTAYWIDIALQSNGAALASLTNIDPYAEER